MRGRWIVGFVAVVAATTSCTDLFGPSLPSGAVVLDPLPAEYAGWWSLTERCSGLQGRLSDVRWYLVPEVEALPGQDRAAGQYQSADHRVVFAEPYVRDGFIVRHEMLHALGAHGHTRALFRERCGGVVGCGERCRADAGTDPVWNTNLPLAVDGDVVVDVELLPNSVAVGADHCPSIAVSMTNVAGQPRTIDPRRGFAFGFMLEGWGSSRGGGPLLADDRIVLDDARPWTWVVDCPAVLQERLSPGEYIIRGMFDGLSSDAAILTIES